ncbi:unnamed protein product [Rotaria sp. Silwood2]|nr:unnamed protein product [Rotaria sp. Silwood2]
MSSTPIDQHQQQLSSLNLQCRERSSEARLHLYNNLTKKKELFVPINGNEVRWYSCGPSFYDKFHMDVVRYYITLDILRRVMKNYFGYDVVYYMIIHDVDEKIFNLTDEKNSKTNMDIDAASAASTPLCKESINNSYDFPKLSKTFNSIMKYNDTNRKLSQDMFNKLFEALHILPPSFGSFTSLTDIMSSTVFDICTSGCNLNSARHDGDTAQLQAFNNNNIVSSMTYVIEIGGLAADQNEIATVFNTTDELTAKNKHHNLRLYCLLNPWSSMLNLMNNENDNVTTYHRAIKSFIHDVGKSLKTAKTLKLINPYIILNEYDNKMNQEFSEIKKKIYIALCDGIDLPGAMEQIMNLMTITEEYTKMEKIHVKLIENIYDFIMNLLKIFGLKYEDVFHCNEDY